jgi:hypothetical protein
MKQGKASHHKYHTRTRTTSDDGFFMDSQGFRTFQDQDVDTQYDNHIVNINGLGGGGTTDDESSIMEESVRLFRVMMWNGCIGLVQNY